MSTTTPTNESQNRSALRPRTIAGLTLWMIGFAILMIASVLIHVRAWRYHWLFFPLQTFAVLNILLVGYSRVEAGSHWLTDVLGGYISGTLWLVLHMALYRWTTGWPIAVLKNRRSDI